MIKIIAGQWRSRPLPVAVSAECRPTPGRVRETLFNWLAPYIQGMRCCDLYSGSGALGFEALSRGAKHCTFIERDPKIAQQLRQGLTQFKANDLGMVINTPALAYLRRAKELPFDLLFLDPPFKTDQLEECLKRLSECQFTQPVTWLYIETSRHKKFDLPNGWTLHKSGEAGAVAYYLVKLAHDENNDRTSQANE